MGSSWRFNRGSLDFYYWDYIKDR